VVAAKKLADANRIIQDFGIDDIQVLNGRYGPYITDKQRNARIPKERDPKTLTLEECRALLAAAPQRPGRFGRKTAAKGKGAATDKAAAKRKTANKEESADGSEAITAGAAAPKKSTPKKKVAKKSPAKKTARKKSTVASTAGSAATSTDD
jgi:DNA topoisomerase-1